MPPADEVPNKVLGDLLQAVVPGDQVRHNGFTDTYHEALVILSHAAARQIWVAANLAAAHFGYDEKTSRWFDTRSGEELRQKLGARRSWAQA